MLLYVFVFELFNVKTFLSELKLYALLQSEYYCQSLLCLYSIIFNSWPGHAKWWKSKSSCFHFIVIKQIKKVLSFLNSFSKVLPVLVANHYVILFFRRLFKIINCKILRLVQVCHNGWELDDKHIIFLKKSYNGWSSLSSFVVDLKYTVTHAVAY